MYFVVSVVSGGCGLEDGFNIIYIDESKFNNMTNEDFAGMECNSVSDYLLPRSELTDRLRNGFRVENVELKDGIIVGIGGNLLRYRISKDSSSTRQIFVILAEVYKKNIKVGNLVADQDGCLYIRSTAQLLPYWRRGDVVHGKFVYKGGKIYTVPISGTYPKVNLAKGYKSC